MAGHRCVWVGGRGPGGVELCGVDGGVYVAVRVWRGGRGVSADAYAVDLARALADLAGPDVVLGAFSVEQLVGHLKERLRRELEAAKRRYLENRRWLFSLPGVRALLAGDGCGPACARGLLAILANRVYPAAHRLATLQRLLDALDEWLGVYVDVVRGEKPRPLDRLDLTFTLADADSAASVTDVRLLDLLEAIEARLKQNRGDGCRGYECIEVYGERLQAVLAG